MTPMSDTRKIEKGIIEAKVLREAFTQAELKEFIALNDLATVERFKAVQIKANTALIPDGQKVAETQEAIARLMENTKQGWVGSKLTEMGFESGVQVSINPDTGAVAVVPTVNA